MKHDACRTVRDLLALRPADWSAEERGRVEEHLVSCTSCAGMARAYAVQDRLLRRLPAARLDLRQRQQLFAQLEGKNRARRVPSWLSWALGAALVAALLAIVLLIALLPGLDGRFLGGAVASPSFAPTSIRSPTQIITPSTAMPSTPPGSCRDTPAAVGLEFSSTD